MNAKQLGWIAGFLEGEGYFGIGDGGRSGATVRVTQVQREPLERLQDLLGGSVKPRLPKPPHSPAHVWTLCGKHAVGLMMTIYGMMSPRRKDKIKKVLDCWRVAPGSGGHNRYHG